MHILPPLNLVNSKFLGLEVSFQIIGSSNYSKADI